VEHVQVWLYAVVLASRNESKLKQTAAELEQMSAYAKVHRITVDLRSSKSSCFVVPTAHSTI
jgi:short-subunit dehydrogenase